MGPTSAACLFPVTVMQREVATVIQKFEKFLRETSELNWRNLFSQRAPFYDEVRRHLSLNAPSTAVPLSSPLLQLTFQDISEFLVEGWADDPDGIGAERLGCVRSYVPSLGD